jgi:hypothetical protein
LFICLAAAQPVEVDPSTGASSNTLDDQWLHMRTMLRHRRRPSARVDRARVDRARVATEPPPRRVISREQVIIGGCRIFITQGTVDMEYLAISLAISRATLYRVVHSRDELLGEVLWQLAEQELAQARLARTRTGVDGVLDVARSFSRRLLASRAFRRFLANEPETATRILFSARGGVHGRAVEATRRLFLEATPPDQDGRPWLAGDLDKLAYLYVRLFESMYYSELLHGSRPDLDLVEHTARALLDRAAARTAVPA